MKSDKKTKHEIIKKIVESLSKSPPKSIYELSKELGSNWDTIKGNLDLLKELGIIDFSENKVILRLDRKVSLHKDTVAGLPLSDDIRNRIYALAKKICDKWKEVKGDYPNKTQLQKSLIEIAEKIPKLNIPRGWYFYGKVVLIKVDMCDLDCKLDKYNFEQLTINKKELDLEITNLVKRFSKMPLSELIAYQYQNKEDYLIKKEIDHILLSKKFNEKLFANCLYRLIFNFKIIKEDELNNKALSLIKEAISIMVTIAFKKEDNEIDFKIQLIEAFNNFWKMYATYQLYQSLEGELGYDKILLKPIFEDRIDFYSEDLTENFQHLGVNETRG